MCQRRANVDERTVALYLPEPDMPDVDLFVRSSGEQRRSKFLLWQSAYAEWSSSTGSRLPTTGGTSRRPCSPM
jgi:undecaprenyl diphosphate synthase